MFDVVERGIVKIPEKIIKHDFVEQRIISLNSPYAGNAILQPNQRLYFGPNSKLRGKRIVAINLLSLVNFTGEYNGADIVSNTAFNLFTMTIIGSDKKEAIKDYPIFDLDTVQNGGANKGKLRIFNIEHKIEESYIQSTSAVGLAGNFILVFNFYTTNE